jgi:DMSO/TMAO reductase YedYZ molybdopterin-dependent catalytic subunit
VRSGALARAGREGAGGTVVGVSQLDDSPVPVAGPAAAAARPAPWAASVAGAVGAGVGLVVSELPSAAVGAEPSLVTGVGGWFIDVAAAPLKEPAVRLFGGHHKGALVIGMILVCLVLGALLGRAAARRPAVAVVGYGGAAAFGLLVALDRPNASTGHLLAGAALGAGAATATYLALLRVAPREARTPSVLAPAPAGQPAAGTPPGGTPPADPWPVTRPQPAGSRRQFLALSGGAGLVAATAGLAVARSKGTQTLTGPGAPASVVLPAPGDRTPVPPALLSAPPVAGLTPYLTPTERFYRIDTALVPPRVDVGGWRLRLGGMVDRPFELTFDELLALPMVERPVTLSCVSNEVGGDLVGNATWLGVPLADLLERAGVRAGAEQVVGESVDGFTAGFPLAAALDGRDALVAVAMNGEPLPVRHGYPARLVVAGLYGYVSATKWLTEIRLSTWGDERGYWIPRGWAREAPVKTQSRIDVPGKGDVRAGRVAVAGVAWAPTRGIQAVEVEIDGEVAAGPAPAHCVRCHVGPVGLRVGRHTWPVPAARASHRRHR